MKTSPIRFELHCTCSQATPPPQLPETSVVAQLLGSWFFTIPSVSMFSRVQKSRGKFTTRRFGGAAFRIGCAEMCGYRPSMEDSHIIYAQDTWGFFGVLDGHGGDACSGFISRRIQEELAKNGMPNTNDAVSDLAFRLDKEFLDSEQPGGSTAAFVVVQAGSTHGGNPAGTWHSCMTTFLVESGNGVQNKVLHHVSFGLDSLDKGNHIGDSKGAGIGPKIRGILLLGLLGVSTSD